MEIGEKPRVKLVGADGNAYNVLGLCRRAAIKAGKTPEWRDAFLKEATSGNYDQLLRTTMKWFEVE